MTGYSSKWGTLEPALGFADLSSGTDKAHPGEKASFGIGTEGQPTLDVFCLSAQD